MSDVASALAAVIRQSFWSKIISIAVSTAWTCTFQEISSHSGGDGLRGKRTATIGTSTRHTPSSLVPELKECKGKGILQCSLWWHRKIQARPLTVLSACMSVSPYVSVCQVCFKCNIRTSANGRKVRPFNSLLHSACTKKKKLQDDPWFKPVFLISASSGVLTRYVSAKWGRH